VAQAGTLGRVAASKFKLFGVPIVPSLDSWTMKPLIYNSGNGLTNSAYGVNNHGSLVFMGLLYLLAIVVIRDRVV